MLNYDAQCAMTTQRLRRQPLPLQHAFGYASAGGHARTPNPADIVSSAASYLHNMLPKLPTEAMTGGWGLGMPSPVTFMPASIFSSSASWRSMTSNAGPGMRSAGSGGGLAAHAADAS